MKLYVNGGFGQPVGQSTLRWLKSIGVSGIRQDIPFGAPKGHVAKLMSELAATGMEASFIVGGWMFWGRPELGRDDLVPDIESTANEAAMVAGMAADYGVPCAIDAGNEPDLTADYKGDPLRYAQMVRAVAPKVWDANPNAKVTALGVSNLASRGRNYIDAVLQHGLTAGVILGPHPYRTAQAPWDRFSGIGSPQQAVDWLARRNLNFAITEGGWHTAPSRVKRDFPLCWYRKTVQYTDDDVAKFAKWELDFWEKEGALWYVWFQLNDGRDPNNHEARFGIRDINGTPKPIVDTFKARRIA